jgi:hypothetical protein
VSPAFISIVVTVVTVAVFGLAIAATGGASRAVSARRALSFPTSWIVLGAMLLVVGVVVAPRLLGFTFLFLPFIWSRGRGRGGPRGRRHEPDNDPFDEDR